MNSCTAVSLPCVTHSDTCLLLYLQNAKEKQRKYAEVRFSHKASQHLTQTSRTALAEAHYLMLHRLSPVAPSQLSIASQAELLLLQETVKKLQEKVTDEVSSYKITSHRSKHVFEALDVPVIEKDFTHVSKVHQLCFHHWSACVHAG